MLLNWEHYKIQYYLQKTRHAQSSFFRILGLVRTLHHQTGEGNITPTRKRNLPEIKQESAQWNHKKKNCIVYHENIHILPTECVPEIKRSIVPPCIITVHCHFHKDEPLNYKAFLFFSFWKSSLICASIVPPLASLGANLYVIFISDALKEILLSS